MRFTSNHDLKRLILPCALIVTLSAMTLIQSGAYLNHDVAWFSWAAGRMLEGSVLGREILEPNFPMAYIIYMPSALLSSAIGVSAATKLWIILLSGVCIGLAIERLQSHQRFPVLIVIGIFLTLAMPREWGQREYLAFVMVLPYCIPAKNTGWRTYLVGALAGLGFAIKPHFLIAWALVEIGQKPFRPEQRGLLVCGLVHALIIGLFFRDFLFSMLPLTNAVYDAFDRTINPYPFYVAAAMCLAVAGTALRSGNTTAFRSAIAAFGFALAALAQQRQYGYQMLPCWGFLCLAAGVMIAERRTLSVTLGSLIVMLVGVQLAPPAIGWLNDNERRGRTIPHLVSFLNQYRSFTVLAVHPYPAFPTALHTSAEYLGMSNSQWFLPAIAQSQGKNRIADKFGVEQATNELSRNPDVVIVDTDWRRHTMTNREWSGLHFLKSDNVFAERWQSYRKVGSAGGFDLYLRRQSVARPAPMSEIP